ncbi:hypothetical protein SAMN05421688_0951 [Poseidonocella pacifica]|uniref:DUF1223 domain-containing protein n=1 Tax=Poseidonocella pacifica TaxID=871651 RepID=A0A1I0VTG9_9RHOB|nr:DUF1223 domain-containing protein [Poseidonocella pacifica]SFA79488.1 hypothetical protein SAMN05421688_0951 [Poseidonocella pacifica]
MGLWTMAARALALVVGLFPAVAFGDERPVLVELFTSQGCSSCPQADVLMKELAEREDVIALSFHVDYWDYLGWKDSFADPAFTARQKGYAQAMRERMVYTPQMIIAGAEHVVGTKPMKIANAIDRHNRHEAPIRLRAERSDGALQVWLRAVQPLKRPVRVELMRYLPRATVEIRNGENAGKTVEYVNVVREMRRLGEWSGEGEFHARVPLTGDLPAVVIVQGAGFGEVLTAAQLR